MNPKPFLIIFLFALSSFSTLPAQQSMSILYASGNYLRTIQMADSILTSDSAMYQAWYYKAQSQSALYRYADAVNSYNQAIKYSNDSASLLFLLAQSLDNAGNKKAAIQIFQQVVRIDSLHVPAKARLAALYLNQRDYLQAIELYASLIRNDSTNGLFFSRLAYACNLAGLTPAAINYYNQALKLNPNDSESAIKLLEIYLSVNMLLPKADSVADTLMVLFPNNVELMKNKACILSINGNYTVSIKLFSEVVAMGDSSLFTCQNFGNTLFNNGNYPEAVFWLRRFANERPENIDNLYALALANQKNYQYTEALGLLDTVLMQVYNTKTIAQTFAQRALTYKMYGDYTSFRDSLKKDTKLAYQSALNDYLLALHYDENQYEVCFQLAKLYEEKFGNLPMAIEQYEKCIIILKAKGDPVNYSEWLTQKITRLKEEQHFKSQ